MTDRSSASRPRLRWLEGRPGAETARAETEKRRVDLLSSDDWGCLLAPSSGPGARDSWQILSVHPKERKIRRRIELVE
jgi:hypothetical protein